MNNVEYLGFIAGVFVSVSLIPQLIKSWKTRSTKDIALSWSIINLTGQILWLTYGVFVHSISLVVMSGIALIMNCIMVVLKVKFK